MTWSAPDQLLWAAGLVEHSILLLALVRGARWRAFPVLTALAGYEVYASLWLLLSNRFGTNHTYFVAYWIVAGLDYLFQLALMVEIARAIFPRTAGWIYGWRGQLAAFSFLGASVAGLLCVLMSPPGVAGLDLWDERINLFTSLLICEVYVSITMTANRLKLQWSDHVAALGHGVALWSAAAVIGDVAHAIDGWRASSTVFDQARMITYLGVLVYWIYSLSRPEQAKTSGKADIEIVLDHYQLSGAMSKSKPGGEQ